MMNPIYHPANEFITPQMNCNPELALGKRWWLPWPSLFQTSPGTHGRVT